MMRDIACEWTLVTAPDTEPITRTQAKLSAALTQTDEDSLIDAWIAAGRQAAEMFLGRALFEQTWLLSLAAFAEVVWLPMAAPLRNDAGNEPIVTYYDANGVLQTLATSYYEVDTTSEPGCIRRAPGVAWPAVQADRARPVQITYVCGHGAVADIPELVKQGIRLYVAAAEADRLGGPDADASRRAAEACWRSSGQVFWRAPQSCRYAS